jgi:hypothetical protein
LIRLETGLYTIFAYIPLIALITIPFFIAGIVKKKRNQKYGKLFVTGGIFLGIFVLWLAVLFAGGMYGFGPGRFDAAKDISNLFVKNISKETPVGVGVLLNYADDKTIIFQGEFGLFGYDLANKRITFSVDLEKAVGITAFQGSESCAVVRVAADGSQIQLYNSDTKDPVYYIDPSKGTYTLGPYQEMENAFDPIKLEDGSMGELGSTNPAGAVGTIGELCFRRDNQVWLIFENWDFGQTLPALTDGEIAAAYQSNDNDKKPELMLAEKWFTSQTSRYDVITGETRNNHNVILVGDKNPEVEGLYTSFRVFVMQKDGDVYLVKAAKTVETAMSAGFSASVLVTDGMTIVFGDIADGIYDFSSDKIMPAEFSEARVIYDDGKDATTVISNNTPYMLILDGEVEVKDIEYSGDGTNVKYSDYFSDDLMTDVTSEETGFE